MISLSPSGDRETLLAKLKHSIMSLMNVTTDSNSKSIDEFVKSFADWQLLTAGALRDELVTAELERLVFDVPRGLYSVVHGGVTATRRAIELDIELRLDALEDAVGDLERLQREWSGLGQLVTADTSFFLNHPDKIADVHFGDLLGVSGSVHLILPTIVIDELDGLKQHSNSQVRWRAGHTLGKIDEIYRTEPIDNVRWIHYQDEGFPSTSLEIVPDPPGHRRLEIADDEIVDRALAIQYLAGRQVTLITYDTGQSTRALFRELAAVKLPGRRRGGHRPVNSRGEHQRKRSPL